MTKSCCSYSINTEVPELLAAVVATDGEATDHVINEVIDQLLSRGYLIGGLQQRIVDVSNSGCGVRLQSISTGSYHRVTQDLGNGSTSCNIDSDALERLAFSQMTELNESVEMLVVNRFGKREAEGAGFCCVFERAIELGIPVLTVVKESWLPQWTNYGGEFVGTLKPGYAEIMAWCESVLPQVAQRSM